MFQSQRVDRFVAKLLQYSLPASYLCILLAGVAAIIAPPASIATTTSNILTAVWSVVIIAGALCGMVGTLTNRPGVELLGSPGLFVALLTYGVVLLIRQWSIPGLASNGTVVAWLVIGLTVGSVFYRGLYLLSVAERWESSLR